MHEKQYSFVYVSNLQAVLFSIAEYVREIFQTIQSLSESQLSDEAKKIKDMTPAPMNTMLEKQPRDEAVKHWRDRKSIVAIDVQGTTPLGK